MKTKCHQVYFYFLHFLKAKRKGHGVHSPFAYYLCEEVFYNTSAFYEFEKLQAIRASLLQNQEAIPVIELGAGSQRLSEQQRKVSEITRHGISSSRQSELLFRLIQVLKLGNVIELGTSVGLTSLYLQAAGAETYTIEGNPHLTKFAKTLAEKKGYSDIHFCEGHFDKILPILREELKTINLLYIDGNHRYEATLRYVTDSLPYLTNDSVIILDDIYWSPEMTKAWKEICRLPQVTLALDLYHFGILFFKKEIMEKQVLSLYI